MSGRYSEDLSHNHYTSNLIDELDDLDESDSVGGADVHRATHMDNYHQHRDGAYSDDDDGQIIEAMKKNSGDLIEDPEKWKKHLDGMIQDQTGGGGGGGGGGGTPNHKDYQRSMSRPSSASRFSTRTSTTGPATQSVHYSAARPASASRYTRASSSTSVPRPRQLVSQPPGSMYSTQHNMPSTLTVPRNMPRMMIPPNVQPMMESGQLASSRSQMSSADMIQPVPPRKNYVQQNSDSYLTNIDQKLKKRKIPHQFFKDPEAMYMEIQELKQKLSRVQTENTKVKTQLQKTEFGQQRKQKQVEELLRAHAIVETKGQHYENLFKEINLVKSLKQRVRDLEKDLFGKEEEIGKLKMDSRHTRVRELETELKAYYRESIRLQKIVEQLQQQQAAQPKSRHQTADEVAKLKDKNSKFRDLLVKMKQMQEHLREQNEHLNTRLQEMQNRMPDSVKPQNNEQNYMLKDEVLTLRTQVLELQNAEQQAKKQLQQKDVQFNQSLAQQDSEFNDRIDQLQSKLAVATSAAKDAERYKKECEDTRTKLSELEATVSTLQSKLSGRDSQIASLKQELETAIAASEIPRPKRTSSFDFSATSSPEKPTVAAAQEDLAEEDNPFEEEAKEQAKVNNVVVDASVDAEAEVHRSNDYAEEDDEEENGDSQARRYTFEDEQPDTAVATLTYDEAAAKIQRQWRAHSSKSSPTDVTPQQEPMEEKPHAEVTANDQPSDKEADIKSVAEPEEKADAWDDNFDVLEDEFESPVENDLSPKMDDSAIIEEDPQDSVSKFDIALNEEDELDELDDF